MSFGVIFDLDQTLVDSRSTKALRDRRDWDSVYPMIKDYPVYEGIYDAIELLSKNKIPMAIVTASQVKYCGKVVELHRFAIEHRVTFYDTPYGQKKPHPAPILKGIDLLKVKADRVWSIGDDPKDVEATHRAGAHSVAALWGADKPDELLALKPKHVCKKVKELHELFEQILAGKIAPIA